MIDFCDDSVETSTENPWSD